MMGSGNFHASMISCLPLQPCPRCHDSHVTRLLQPAVSMYGQALNNEWRRNAAQKLIGWSGTVLPGHAMAAGRSNSNTFPETALNASAAIRRVLRHADPCRKRSMRPSAKHRCCWQPIVRHDRWRRWIRPSLQSAQRFPCRRFPAFSRRRRIHCADRRATSACSSRSRAWWRRGR